MKHYEVYYFSPDNPQHLSQWLDNILIESGLKLVTINDGYWIFEPFDVALTTERDSLKAALAEANKDADRLAKELQDWIVFAEANDQIYAARSGMNAMLHHLKRKESK